MNSPSIKSTLPTAIFLALIGWGGVFYLIVATLPTLGPRWLFFFFSVLAVTGSMLPIAAFLNMRFPTEPRANLNTVVREAILVGIYCATLVWLQLGRALTPGLALLLLLGVGLLEWFLRLREKSRWEP